MRVGSRPCVVNEDAEYGLVLPLPCVFKLCFKIAEIAGIFCGQKLVKGHRNVFKAARHIAA